MGTPQGLSPGSSEARAGGLSPVLAPPEPGTVPPRPGTPRRTRHPSAEGDSPRRCPGSPCIATLLSCAAVLLPACGDPAPAPPPPAPAGSPAAAVPGDAPLVAFLGDSIAAGLHLKKEDAFPAVLQRELEAEGVPFRLVNAGVSGDTTAGGRARLDWILRQKPDVVVVELGANDGFRGVPVETMEGNLRDILDRVKAAGAKPLLLGMRLPPNYGPAYVRDFAGMYRRLADATGTPLVDHFMDGVAGRADRNLPDLIHPTAEGHRVLAGTVKGALRDLLD